MKTDHFGAGLPEAMLRLDERANGTAFILSHNLMPLTCLTWLPTFQNLANCSVRRSTVCVLVGSPFCASGF